MPQPVGRYQRVVGVGVWQQDRELVTTDAEGTVAVAQGVADGVGHAYKQAIAGRMAFAVVDDLEVVEVDQQQRHRHVVATVEVELAVQLLLEGAVVAQSGETIVERVLARFPVQHLQLRSRLGQVVEGLEEGTGQGHGHEQHHDRQGGECGQQRISRRFGRDGPEVDEAEMRAVVGLPQWRGSSRPTGRLEGTSGAAMAGQDAVDADAQIAQGLHALDVLGGHGGRGAGTGHDSVVGHVDKQRARA